MNILKSITVCNEAGQPVATVEVPYTSWVMKETTMEFIRESLELGVEYAQESLAAHDASLGRTTRKNKSLAEMIETHIAKMQEAYKKAEDPDGSF